MPKNEKKPPTPCLPPTGGQMLHAIVDALRLRERDPDSLIASDIRHVANYFHGDPLHSDDRVQDGYRQSIVRSIAAELFASKMLPTWTFPDHPKVACEDLLADALLRVAGFADAVRAILVPRAHELTDPLIAWWPLLHIAAVEIGMRLGGLFVMAGIGKPLPTRTWATAEGAGWFLRHWTSRGISKPMSQADLLRAVEKASSADNNIDRPMISKWMNGQARPSIENTKALAIAIANHQGHSPDDVHRAFEWHEALHAIARRITKVMAMGCDERLCWDVLGSAATLALDVLRATMDYLPGIPLAASLQQGVAGALFLKGTDWRVPLFDELLPFLADRLQDPTKRIYVLRACADLGDLLNQLFNSARDLDWQEEELRKQYGWSSSESRDNLRRIVTGVQEALLRGDIPSFPKDGSANTQGLTQEDMQAACFALAAASDQARGDDNAAERLWRQAVETSPKQARYRYKLGATLARLRRTDDAIRMLRSAIELQPDWEMPRGEIGVILLNSGRAAEAEVELRQHLVELGRRDPWLLQLLGGALNLQKRWPEACGCFEESLCIRKNHPETLHQAAKAFLFAGDLRRGLALAKQAADLGRHEMLNRYHTGEFGSRSKRNGATPGEEV